MRTSIITAILFPFFCNAQIKKEFEIYMAVSADNLIESQAKSNLSRLLREFSDVTITDAYDCDYEVRIILIENSNKSGYKTGYTASINILKPLTPTDFTFPIAQRLTNETTTDEDDFFQVFQNKQKIDTSYIYHGIADKIYQQGVYQPVNSFLFVDDDLRSLCERIIAEIDTEIFEPDRIAHDKIWKK